MKHLSLWPLLVCLVLFSCFAQSPSSTKAPKASATGDTGSQPVTEESLSLPRTPVPADRKVLKTIDINLDADPEEEQIILMQSKANLSLPLTIKIADYDIQRKTSYLAWEGEVLASASQPFDVRVESLISASQKELVVRGITEAGHPCLDIFRLESTGSGLGLQYTRIFSQASLGNIDLDSGQGFASVPVVSEEPDPASKNPLDSIKTIWEWRFQKARYEVVRTEHFRREKQADAALEKLFAGDNAALASFLGGPWVKTATEKKEAPLLLFVDTSKRELIFATLAAQEVYHWEQSIRTMRNAMFLSGSNDLIPLIKLQLSVAIVADDVIELSSPDNPNWSGSYSRLSESAAISLTKSATVDEVTTKRPKGLYRNDKGDQFNFQFPEIQIVLGGQPWTGFGALHNFGGTTVLQVKVPGTNGKPLLSKAYAFSLSEESTSSRTVRTIRLQEGSLTIGGWESNSTDALRLEQVEVVSPVGTNR